MQRPKSKHYINFVCKDYYDTAFDFNAIKYSLLVVKKETYSFFWSLAYKFWNNFIDFTDSPNTKMISTEVPLRAKNHICKLARDMQQIIFGI